MPKCLYCKKKEIKKGRTKFCGRECATKAMSKANEKEIKALYDELKSYAKTGAVYGLSRQRIHQIVKNYHNFGNNGQRKDAYKIAFNPLCQICKKRKTKALHHIDFDNSNDKPENLLPVCGKCHLKLHSVKRREGFEGLGCKECGRKLLGLPKINLKRKMCVTCVTYIKKAKKTIIRRLLYPKNCKDCGRDISKMKRNRTRGRCKRCYFNFIYATDVTRREGIKRAQRNFYYRNREWCLEYGRQKRIRNNLVSYPTLKYG